MLCGASLGRIQGATSRVLCGRRRCSQSVLRSVSDSKEGRVKYDSRGFVGEMYQSSMKLHKGGQKASKEKKKKAAEEKPFPKWEYTREGFLRFLVESKLVYNALENIIYGNGCEDYVAFQGSGLERAQTIDTDISWIEDTYGLKAPEALPDGPGHTYAQVLTELSVADPPAFICHYYNVSLAHTAGGRMIGKKVAENVLDGRFDDLAFYRYEGSLQEKVDGFKHTVNQVAEKWTRKQKDRCLEETERSFKLAGSLLQTLFS